jgi:hypothetical protein
MCNFSCAGHFEPFLGTGICFYLRHLMQVFIFTPGWRLRTDEELFGPFGQSGHGSPEMGCKSSDLFVIFNC